MKTREKRHVVAWTLRHSFQPCPTYIARLERYDPGRHLVLLQLHRHVLFFKYSTSQARLLQNHLLRLPQATFPAPLDRHPRNCLPVPPPSRLHKLSLPEVAIFIERTIDGLPTWLTALRLPFSCPCRVASRSAVSKRNRCQDTTTVEEYL